MIISSNRPDSVCFLILACFVQKLYVLATSAVRPDCKLGQHFSFDVHLVILTWLCVRSSLIFGALRGSVALSCFVRDYWHESMCTSVIGVIHAATSSGGNRTQTYYYIVTKWFLINYVVCVIFFWHVCIEIPPFFTAEAVSRESKLGQHYCVCRPQIILTSICVRSFIVIGVIHSAICTGGNRTYSY